MEIYVSKESRGGDGTKEYPLNSLAQAAIIAKPGDEVIVAPGVYRDCLLYTSGPLDASDGSRHFSLPVCCLACSTAYSVKIRQNML